MRLTFLGKNRENHCVHLGIQSLLDAYTAKSAENFTVISLSTCLSLSLPFSTQEVLIYEIFKKVAVGYRFGPQYNAHVTFFPLYCFLFPIRFPITLLTKPAIQRLL